MFGGELAAGAHDIVLPDQVPPEASFATVTVGTQVRVLTVGRLPTAVTRMAPKSSTDRRLPGVAAVTTGAMPGRAGAELDLPHGEPRIRTMPGQRLLNVVVRGLMRIPGFSGVIGRRLLTLYLVGRRSGRRYSVPVTYLADGNDLLLGTSAGWRHNLRSGQTVAVRLKGKRRLADVTTYSKESEVVSVYAQMARANPTFAKFNSIRLNDDGRPDDDDLRLAWIGGAHAIRLSRR